MYEYRNKQPRPQNYIVHYILQINLLPSQPNVTVLGSRFAGLQLLFELWKKKEFSNSQRLFLALGMWETVGEMLLLLCSNTYLL